MRLGLPKRPRPRKPHRLPIRSMKPKRPMQPMHSIGP